MKVVNCTVDDGHGDRVPVIDAHGCSLDRNLIGNLDYSPTSMMANVEAHAFKFADRASLYFQCEIRLCVALEGGCEDTVVYFLQSN